MLSEKILDQLKIAFSTFYPFHQWRSWFQQGFTRLDLQAGLIGAIIALPQAIALALLAGMPPIYGVYTSIIPVMMAAVWGSSWHLLSGPNTAMSVLLAATIAPIASQGSEIFILYIFFLTLMVGLVQLAIGLLRLGVIINFISNTVIVAIVQAVAILIILSSIDQLLGIEIATGSSLNERLLFLANHLNEINALVFIVGIITLLVAIFGKRLMPRFILVIAIMIGSGLAYYFNHIFGGVSETGIQLIGLLPLEQSPFIIPDFSQIDTSDYRQLFNGALALAFLGLMQSIVIARMLAQKTGQKIDINKEIVSQGVSNTLAPFVSSFAGSGSFNRSAANQAVGAKSPMAAIYGSVLLLLIVFGAGELIALIPDATIAAVLLLVAYNLIDIKSVKRSFYSHQEGWIFSITFITALTFDLSSGVFAGMIASLCFYLWKTSQPNISNNHYVSRTGEMVHKVTIDGNLFFGSTAMAQKLLPSPPQTKETSILFIDTNHITYIDFSGVELLHDKIKEWINDSHKAYVLITRESIDDLLEQTKFIDDMPNDIIIRPDHYHPMREILNPYQQGENNSSQQLDSDKTESDKKSVIDQALQVDSLATTLHASAIFGPLPIQQIKDLLDEVDYITAFSGDIISNADNLKSHHFILTHGQVEAQQSWISNETQQEKTHTWTLNAVYGEKGNSIETPILAASSRKLRLRALSDIKYILIDADELDELIGWSKEFSVDDKLSDQKLSEQLSLIRHISIFHQLPVENIQEAFHRMKEVKVEAGDIIIRQGDEGDSYYIIELGEAEVIRTDPFTDETTVVAQIGIGKGFGEEALIQGGYRNASIKMLTPGLLKRLDKIDFEELIQPAMVNEISAMEAEKHIGEPQSIFLDCRYDMEYEEERIPDAQFIPLHELRLRTAELDPDKEYIVYCRSGRRSRAAAFLLQERQFKVASLVGGLKNWPYAIDSEKINVSDSE